MLVEHLRRDVSNLQQLQIQSEHQAQHFFVLFMEVTHLWAREYPISDTAERAAISLRVAVDVREGIGMDGLLVVMIACYSSAG